ncbi:MAG: hypothetical protein OXC00_11140 [Acidimicrobiaceae bacterium]|nr:hypothetical protein [Acidimicrobiaceae bacterium]
MSRVLTRAVRLLKFGAVAGALVGVGRLVVQRRRRSQVDESSWPTIAETAAQNGEPVDEAGTGEADGEDPDSADTPAEDGDGSSAEEAGKD